MGRAFRDALLEHHKRSPRGWQVELNRRTGIDLPAISKIVNGKRIATTAQMLTIARALDAPELLPAELGSAPPVRGAASGQPVTKSRNPRLPSEGSDRSGTVPPSLDAYLEKYGDKISHKDAQLAARLVFKLDSEAPELDPERFWNGVFETIRKSRKGA